jgi:hypothetical protein
MWPVVEPKAGHNANTTTYLVIIVLFHIVYEQDGPENMKEKDSPEDSWDSSEV